MPMSEPVVHMVTQLVHSTLMPGWLRTKSARDSRIASGDYDADPPWYWRAWTPINYNIYYCGLMTAVL